MYYILTIIIIGHHGTEEYATFVLLFDFGLFESFVCANTCRCCLLQVKRYLWLRTFCPVGSVDNVLLFPKTWNQR
jgi:hypothetical protein